jgi:hypothetical protein
MFSENGDGEGSQSSREDGFSFPHNLLNPANFQYVDGVSGTFHDLKHPAITELSEGGVSDATMMGVSG